MISILIVSFNTREMTLECIRSVLKETKTTDFEILVLDNASSDNSAESISTEFNNLLNLTISKKNLGFAAGNNLLAEKSKGDKLLLLNPDTIVLNGAIDNLVKFSTEYPNAGIWGGRTLFKDGSLNPSSCWKRQTIWSLISQACGLNSLFRKSNLFNPEGMGGWDRNGVRHVDIVSGCFLLIENKIWKSLGGFQEAFFMYGEEADLCMRALKLGYKPMVSSEATIVHYGGASENIKTDKMVKLLRAKALLITTHFPYLTREFARFTLALWPLSRYIAFSALNFFLKRESYLNKKIFWHEVHTRKSEWY